MPRTSTRPKVESFNFRVDSELKAAFTATTAKEDRPAGQVLRDLIRATRTIRQLWGWCLGQSG